MSEKEYIFVGTAQLKTRDYIHQLEKENREKDKEITRLNNIIEELEKYLIEHIDEYRDMEQDAMFEFGLVLDKLKELKKGNK